MILKLWILDDFYIQYPFLKQYSVEKIPTIKISYNSQKKRKYKGKLTGVCTLAIEVEDVGWLGKLPF